jgi:hypothetical protein
VSKGRIVKELCTGKEADENGHGLFLNRYPGIGLEGPRKTTKNRSQSSRHPGRVSNRAPALFTSDTLLPEPVCSVVCLSHLLTCVMLTGELYSAVGITTGYWLDGRGVGVGVSVEARIFSTPRRPDRIWNPPSLVSNGYRELFPWVKAAGA